MLFRKTIDRLIAETKTPVAIFDLDGTLFDVTHRTIEIMRRFLAQKEIHARFPEQSEIVGALKYKDYLYSLEATLNRAGIDRYSEHAAHFIHLAETFWFKHFFTDELLAYDHAYSGAVECVQDMHKRGVYIFYLSGRDIPNMSQGTLKALEKAGFPHKGHGISLCLKPAYGQNDLLFKRQSLETMRAAGEVIATFDNEPANVQMFIEEFPKAIHVHFDSHYATPIEIKGDNLIVIKNFSEAGFTDVKTL